jgi:hypothetical protein
MSVTLRTIAFMVTPHLEFEQRPRGVPQARGTLDDMTTEDAIERISQLLGSDMTETSNTSMRIPTALREAAALAASELGAAPSATALTTVALRTTLEAVVMQAVLDDHYARYPGTRPDLADLAIAAAEIDGHPLAADPGLIRRATAELTARHPHPEPEDVLLWAEARALSEP